ncbi:SDR family NAD(P)-dependent oxidoreductase [Georgenia sp. SYP-B2076]|uniref:SDR family NAD(P)-dependent oxidoreductase n=1 Tax=Georgenia sp. SYP-B2076 TaxID=2495881 RepID=UPI000F8C66B5|nr:SDR family NAD(P)-dependent oxidoreductase [Georgenia sp. SYP-B2076]
MRTWLITGASRGLGAQLVRVALEHGDNVIAGMRDPSSILGVGDIPRALLPAALDVTDAASTARAVAAGLERFGKIDVLVNNAGRHLRGAVEEISDSEARAVFDVNFFGALNAIREVLPHFRTRRTGRIINIGSMSGFRGTPGAGMYSATKFALEGLSEALSGELVSLGIHTTVVEPGGLRTDFLDASSLREATSRIADYEPTPAGASHRAWVRESNHSQPGDPRKAAEAVYTVATAEHPPTHMPLGSDAIAAWEKKRAELSEEIADWRPLSDIGLE